MKAEEIKKICGKWLVKAYLTGQRVDPYSADNSEFYMPMIDLSWSPKMADELQQYVDEVSREVAVDFELRHVYKGASKSAKKLAYMQFDEWKSKQEQS